MGGLCCCPRPEDFEEYTSYPNGSIYQNCFCLRCCVRWCLRMYSSYIDPGDGRDTSSPTQGGTGSQAAGLLGTSSLDTSLPDTFRAPPRPLPYDIDPRYLRIPRDGLVSRRDKSGMSQLHGVEAEPLRQRTTGDGSEALTQMQRRNGGGADEFDDTEKRAPAKMGRNESMLSLTDDEDSCPTCLDGYTEENPKINPQCGHHFHLGCILEWMERSKRCPVCDKEMVFSESV
ncbi:unnamed protein product [Calypogeia fissa]